MRRPGLSAGARGRRAAPLLCLGGVLRCAPLRARAWVMAELLWGVARLALAGGGGPWAYRAGRGAAVTGWEGGRPCGARLLLGCP